MILYIVNLHHWFCEYRYSDTVGHSDSALSWPSHFLSSCMAGQDPCILQALALSVSVLWRFSGGNLDSEINKQYWEASRISCHVSNLGGNWQLSIQIWILDLTDCVVLKQALVFVRIFDVCELWECVWILWICDLCHSVTCFRASANVINHVKRDLHVTCDML